jgi:hypothetical protein
MPSASQSRSQILTDRMQITCGRLYETLHWLWCHPRLPDLMPPFLILMHQIVRASVPLMNAARRAARTRAAADPVCRQLVGYLTRHIEEERHHDEWILDDLAAAGIRRGDVTADIPSPAVASLVGAQYYWIEHHHPVALLGYVRVLEGNPPSAAHIQRVQAISGLPPTAFRTYRRHAELDPQHGAEINQVLDRLPVSEQQGCLIWISASHTAGALANCLKELERASFTGKRNWNRRSFRGAPGRPRPRPVRPSGGLSRTPRRTPPG